MYLMKGVDDEAPYVPQGRVNEEAVLQEGKDVTRRGGDLGQHHQQVIELRIALLVVAMWCVI